MESEPQTMKCDKKDPNLSKRDSEKSPVQSMVPIGSTAQSKGEKSSFANEIKGKYNTSLFNQKKAFVKEVSVHLN